VKNGSLKSRKPEILWESVPSGRGPEYIRVSVLSRKAEVLELTGFWNRAEAIYRDIYEIIARLNWPAHLRIHLRQYALLLHRLNKLHIAWEVFSRLEMIAKEDGDPKTLADTLSGYGIIQWRKGELADAEKNYLKAREILQKIEDEEGLSAIYNNLGVLYENMGRYAEALEVYQRKREIEERREDLPGLSRLHNNLGIVYLHMEDLDNAERNFQKRLDLARRMGDIYGQATVLTNLGVLARMRERYREALDRYQAARSLYLQLGELRTVEVTISLNMGNIYLDLGDWERAESYFQASMKAAEKYRDRKTQGIGLYNLGKIEYQRGHIPEAVDLCSRASEILETISQPYYFMEALHYRAQLLFGLSRWNEVVPLLEKAIGLAEKLGKDQIKAELEKMLPEARRMSDADG